MTKNKKISITICTLMLITLCYFMPTFIRSNYSVVRADSSVDFDDTKYTDSDQLLKKDGTFSDKSIQKFAKEVQDGKNDTYFPELAEVIPRKYLETSAGKATFAYNGKEYGFYVVKDRAEFNVLLIDFSYEFDDDDQIHTSDLEYVIRIKPILQQTFKRSRDSSGAYTYMKVENEDRYYVANPRFASVLRNENDLNYGDDGYDKLKDDGVMISQTRLNYSKIAYSTGNDLITNIENFTIKKLTSAPKDFAYDLLDSETYGVGGTILKFFDELDQDIVDAGKEETIVADNETNIKTGISREEQRNDPNIPSYLRIVGVMPEGEIVLSGTTNSYAEMITVVDNANSRTRLNQLCEFDIFYRSGDYSTMKTVASDYGFSKERILFDNKSVTPLEDEVSQDDYAYILKGGNHRFSYQCNDTTGYRFIFDGQLPEIAITCNGETVETSKVNDNVYEAVFEKGKNYLITFSGLPAGIHNFTFCKKTENIDSFGERNIKSFAVGESKWFEYTPQKDTYLSIDCDTNKYGVYIYNSVKGENLTVNGCTNHTEFLALANQKYYV